MKHMTICVLSLLVMAMVLCGCKSETEQKTSPEPKTNPTTMPTTIPTSTPGTEVSSDAEVVCDYVFREAHFFQEMTYMFVFHDEKVFVKIAKFPGNVDQRYYLVDQLPPELRELVTHWTTKEAETWPPYVPEGWAWGMSHVPRTSPESGEMRDFEMNSEEVMKFREAIVAHIATEENEISSPPEWVTEIRKNEEIMIRASIDALHRKLDESSQSPNGATE